MAENVSVQENVDILAAYEDTDLLSTLKAVLENRPAVLQALVDWAVPDRAYASARLLLENRLTGTIKSFNRAKGYGFIECPAVKEAFASDVFLHNRQAGPYDVGVEVSFAILLNTEKKPQAFELHSTQEDQLQKGGKGTPSGGLAGQGKMPFSGNSGVSTFWGQGNSGNSGVSTFWGQGKGAKSAIVPASAPAGKLGPPTPAPAKGQRPMTMTKGSDSAPETAIEMPGVTDRLFEGHIKSFNQSSGFGFIKCDELRELFGQDVFLHHRQLNNCEVGQHVCFTPILNKDSKPQAKDLMPLDGVGALGQGGAGALAGIAGALAGMMMPQTSPVNSAQIAGQRPWTKGSAESPKSAIEMPGVTDRMFEGHIKSFNQSKGFGFVACEELTALFGGDAFLHSKQLNNCEVGQRVNFAVTLNKDAKPQAKDLIPLDGGGADLASLGCGSKRPAAGPIADSVAKQMRLM